MLTFVKLGGSLITDKLIEKSFKRDVMKRLAGEIASAVDQDPSLRILLGHGSGSFGHFAAQRANIAEGVRTREDWVAIANISAVASELNGMVCECMREAGLPIWRLQPSASLLADNGEVVAMNVDTIKAALDARIIPVIYGDIALDRLLGGVVISTEKLFYYLTSYFPVQRIFLLGEVSGVYNENGQVISVIRNDTFDEISSSLKGSAGIDVTGGMETKVSDMLRIVERSSMTIRIFSGREEKLLAQTLLGKTMPGTLISY